MKKILTLCAALLLFGQSRISADPVAANSFPRPSKEEPLLAPEVMPSFRGGDMNNFMSWLNSNLVFPEKAEKKYFIQGKVLASFVIEKNGRLTNIEILSSTDILFSKEVIRVLKNSPQWSPGTVDDKPVRTGLTVPVTFRASKWHGFDCERLPVFMGCHPREFLKWVSSRLAEYPRAAIKYGIKKERVNFRFTVDETGCLKDIEILNDCSRPFSEEVIRVMKTSPKWEPGLKDGKNCEVTISTSIIHEIRQ